MNIIGNADHQLFFFNKKPSKYFNSLISIVRKKVPDSLKEKIKSSKLKPYYDILRRMLIKKKKTPRVFIKKGISRIKFFEILHKRKINYVLLRWWENFPNMQEEEDMDILIQDTHRECINDLLVYYDNKTGLKCDIYTVRGSNYGSHKSLPYFQTNLAEELISTRTYFNGVYVPSPILYFASLSYHAIFHKGYSSGIPGFNKKAEQFEHDYYQILKSLTTQLKLKTEINLEALYNWLKKENYLPAEDTLSKLVEINPELFILQKKLYSDIRGGELIVYIIREKLFKDNLMNDFTKFLENDYNFEIIKTRELNNNEQEKCSKQIRGGKWDKGPYEHSGGLPKAFIVAFDYHPVPLTHEELKTQPRMTNRNCLSAKYKFREKVNNSNLKKRNYNGIHSADNEQDAWYYISLLERNFRDEICDKIELRRNIYAKKWGVIKLLSKGPNSKVELIKYNKDIAVKKTFRPKKENLLKMELYAAKKLSKEIPYFLPILEEGDGYIVYPYQENILKNIKIKKKIQLINKKEKEILDLIQRLFERGLTLINFTPESLIITPEGKLYCTGLSYLNNYKETPPNINQTYEVIGVPEKFSGNLPNNFKTENSSYNKVWGPYLGPWKNQLNQNDKKLSN